MEMCSFDSQFWYTGVATWSRFSATYKKAFCTMYTIDTCLGCGRLYKNCTPGIHLIQYLIVLVSDYTQYHNYALITSVEVTCQYVFFPSFLFYRICWDRKKGSTRSNLFSSRRSGILQSLLQPIAIGRHKFNTNTNPRLNYVTEMYEGLQKDP